MIWVAFAKWIHASLLGWVRHRDTLLSNSNDLIWNASCVSLLQSIVVFALSVIDTNLICVLSTYAVTALSAIVVAHMLVHLRSFDYLRRALPR